MASRIMHLAIANSIADKVEMKDMERFRLGIVLPDAYSANTNKAVSHFKSKICNGTKNIYRLTDFRKMYGDEIKKDSLYLGYYIHLIQDILYRQFVYSTYKWNPRPEGNVARLHNDYRLLNGYLINKYQISDELYIPGDIVNEKLFDVYPFDIQQLEKDFREDFVPYFVPYNEGKSFFFTREMADEYINKAAESCIIEIDTLRNGRHMIDEIAYAWNA